MCLYLVYIVWVLKYSTKKYTAGVGREFAYFSLEHFFPVLFSKGNYFVRSYAFTNADVYIYGGFFMVAFKRE